MNIRKTANGKWAYDFTYGGRRIVKVVGDNQKQAEAAGAKHYSRLIDEKHGLGSPVEDVLFSDLADKYFEFHSKKKRSARRDQVSIGHLKRFFRGERLSGITPLRVEEYRKKRLADKCGLGKKKREVSGSSVNRELAKLKHIFTVAIKWRHAAANPVKEVEKCEEGQPRERILSPEEAARLITAAAPGLKPVLIVALNTGMRRGEILGLRWRNVDYSTNSIEIEAAQAKSKRKRYVPMNGAVRDALRALPRAGEHVFPSSGKQGHVQDVKTAWATACRKAKIRGCRFHDLRHTAASKMVEGGIDLVTVSKILGHSSIQMTMRYAHPSPENMQRAVDRLEMIYQGVRIPVMTEITVPPAVPVSASTLSN